MFTAGEVENGAREAENGAQRIFFMKLFDIFGIHAFALFLRIIFQ